MRIGAWVTILGLAGMAVACGDQPTEVVPDREGGAIALATATSGDGLSIVTDKDDYAPGDTVWFTGAGWDGGDTLDIVLTDEPLTHPPHTWWIPVAGDGTFRDSTYVVDVGDLGVTFTLTATSRATGRSLTVTFTDGNVRVNAAPAGVSFTLNATLFDNTTCSGTGTAVTPAGGTVVTSSAPVSFGTTQNQSIRLVASGLSALGDAFLDWTTSENPTLIVSESGSTLCVAGFGTTVNGGGTHDYTAVYDAKVDLTIDKSDAGATFAVGGTGQYTFSVTNAGTATTTAPIQITDNLPAGLTFASYTGPGWNCPAAGGATSVTCTRSAGVGLLLAPGGTAPVVTLTVNVVSPPSGASYSNTATVSGGGEPADRTGNNSDTETTPVVDVTIDKSHTGDFTRTTQEQYSLLVTNSGPAATTAPITVRDTLPAGLTLVSASGTDWTCNAASPVVCSRALPLAAGDPAPVITVEVTVGAATANSIVNRARVSGGGEGTVNQVTCTAATNCDADATTVVDANNAPHADPGGPYDGAEGSPVSFDGSGSSDPNGTPITYDWDFGDGSPHGSGVSPTHTYPDNGAYTVTLTVSDGTLTDAAGTTATIINLAPTATFGAPSPVDEGSAIALSLTNPSDASSVDQAAGFTYAFDCGDGQGYGNFGSSASRSCPTNDNGSRSLKGKIKDKDDGVTEYSATVAVDNVAPTATFNAPSPVDEGSAIGLSLTNAHDVSSVDEAAGFTYAFDCGDGTGYGGFGSSASHSCPTTDNGNRSVGGKVRDKDGGVREYTGAVLVANVAPTATFNAPSPVDEGTAIGLSLTDAHDVSSADEAAGFTYAFDCGDGAGYGAFGSSASRSCPTSDNGSRAVGGKIQDKDGGVREYTASVTVDNVAPALGAISINPSLVAVNTPVDLSVSFTDPGTADTHTASIDWEGATSAGSVTESNGSGTVSGTHSYASAGIYTVKVTVTDDDNGSGNGSYLYVVVYDPSAGFVTGGGWINSLPGMYLSDPTLGGKANFGFVSKYLKGATVPTGNTEFQFHAAGLNFSSTSYEWLVVSGTAKATYKGVGTLNNSGSYGFLLAVVDGGSTGDKFRIKIWDKTSNATIYDNQVGATDTADPSTLIAGGNIVVQTGKK